MKLLFIKTDGFENFHEFYSTLKEETVLKCYKSCTITEELTTHFLLFFSENRIFPYSNIVSIFHSLLAFRYVILSFLSFNQSNIFIIYINISM
jgi:hypothetical protein